MELLGGQAIIEGVLIHHKRKIAVAVRKPDGKIIVRREAVPFRGSRIPLVRGVVNLIMMLYVGVRMLNFSARVAMGEENGKEESGWSVLFVVLFSLAFALVLFKIVPLGLATLLGMVVPLESVMFSLVDGLVRVGIFVGYVYVLSFFPDVKRLFQYHGAEHKTVACAEAGEPLRVANIRKFSPLHKRCGTAFIFLVFLVSVFVYAFIPQSVSFLGKLGLRLVLLPLIAGVSYEILRLGARFRVLEPLVLPGLWIQKITTQEPDAKQMEVAIRAVKAALQS